MVNHSLALSPVFQSCSYFLNPTVEIWLVSLAFGYHSHLYHSGVDALDAKMKQTDKKQVLSLKGEIGIYTVPRHCDKRFNGGVDEYYGS